MYSDRCAMPCLLSSAATHSSTIFSNINLIYEVHSDSLSRTRRNRSSISGLGLAVVRSLYNDRRIAGVSLIMCHSEVDSVLPGVIL